MRVKCILKIEKQVSKEKYPVNNSREYLEIGKIYNVYGIFFYKGVLNYLIVGQYEKLDEYRTPPTWEPIYLFELVDGEFPPGWYFKYGGDDAYLEKLIDPSSAVLGYKELACNVSHKDKLLEREAEDIKIFLKRKHEIDAWEKNKTDE